MTTKTVTITVVIVAVIFLGCGRVSDLLPNEADVSVEDLKDTKSATINTTWLHYCGVGYGKWRATTGRFDGSQRVYLGEDHNLHNFPVGGASGRGRSWRVDGVRYSFGMTRPFHNIANEYEFGDWVTVNYWNSTISSDVPIDFVYLCFDPNLVESQNNPPVFESGFDVKSTETYLSVTFRLLPEVNTRKIVDSPVVSAIVFADGTVTYQTLTTIWKPGPPSTWEETLKSR